MNILEAIKKRRTIRQFQKKKIPVKILKNCLDAARLSPSARNTQPLEYIVINDQKTKEKVFSFLSWGGKLKQGRPDGNRCPAAYVIVLANLSINSKPFFDVGLATENLILAAFSYGISACILGAFEEESIELLFDIPEKYLIALVIALGYPAEKSVAEDADDLKEYWRDSQGILHVPKRRLEKIVHFNRF